MNGPEGSQEPDTRPGGADGSTTARGFRAVTVPVTDDRWRDFVAARPEAGPFHHPAWALTISEAYGYRPFGLLLQTEHGEAGIPVMDVRAWPRRRRWVALPFTDHCRPLGDTGAPPGILTMLAAARVMSGVRSLEVRAPLQDGAAPESGLSLWHVLQLGADEEAVFRSFHRSQVQRNVRRAEREGVVVRRSTAEFDLTRVFYALHVDTRRRLGVPVQPRRYFEVLGRRMHKDRLGFVSVAEVDGTPAAAAVFLVHNGTVVYKYGASDPRYHRSRANHLLFWDAIRWGCRNGQHTFDFGRTSPGDESLREFKARWGTEERSLSYTVLRDRPTTPSTSEVPAVARAVLRRAPAGVTRAVGATLYRYTA